MEDDAASDWAMRKKGPAVLSARPMDTTNEHGTPQWNGMPCNPSTNLKTQKMAGFLLFQAHPMNMTEEYWMPTMFSTASYV